MIVKVTDIPKIENDLLEYINKETKSVSQRPAGFGITVREYCASQRPALAFSTGRRLLDKLVDGGRLKMQTMKERGHLTTVYYK
jgi:hypothetical protein